MQKGLKIITAAALAVPPMMVGGVAGVDAAQVFKDVPPTQTHYDNIMQLYHENVISGYEDHTFRPNKSITRGQAAKILAGVLGLIKPEDTYNGPDPGFKDITPEHSYYKYIAVLAQAGIINGYPDGTYGANNTLTRGQMSKIIYNGFNLDKFPDVELPFTDVPRTSGYYEQIKSLYSLGVTVGKTKTTYGLSEAVTRGQLASFVIRARHVEDTADTAKIQSIHGNRITLDIGTYTIAPSLQAFLNAENMTALAGADIAIYASKNTIVGIQQIELNARGTTENPIVFDGGEEVFQGNIVVNSEYATLKNITVAGDVLVNGINSGSRRVSKAATFSRVQVMGTTTVKDDYSYVGGSGSNSNLSTTIELNSVNADLGVVSIEREGVVLDTDTAIRRVNVATSVKALKLYGDINTLEVSGREFELEGTGAVTTINYRQAGLLKLSLRGPVGNVNLTKEGGKLYIGTYTTVDILAKLAKLELEDVLVNIDEAASKIGDIIEYGKENSGVASLEELIVLTSRTDKTYLQGEDLDLSEFTVTGVYADGSTKAQRITASNITGYDKNKAGEQTLTFTINGVRAQMKIKVVPMTSLKIINYPTKTIYRVGDSFTTAGIVVEGTYSNGAVKQQTITVNDARGYDLSRSGTQTVTLTVNGKTASYPIRVLAKNEPMLAKITVTKTPSKLKYYQGEALNLSGLTVTGTYSDGKTRTETITAANITGFNSMRGGKQKLTINVNGLTDTFDINVIEMEDLVIKTLPNKKEYKVGETLDLWGLQVVGRYADGSERIQSITAANITGFNSARTGIQTVRVTVNGRAASFDVKVLNVTGISISKLPTKIEYFPGEALDLAGLQIQAQYSDQTTQNFDGNFATVSGFNPSLWGDQVLTVTYDGMTTQFKVRVLPLRSLKVETSPTKTIYSQGESLDLTGLKVIGTYEGDKKREEQITMSMISNFDSSLHNTDQNVMITINGITTTFKVTILKSPLAMSNIVITRQPDRVRYRVGVPFSPKGMIITAVNNDGTTETIKLDDPSLQISEIDTTTAGEKVLKIKYGVFETEMPITVYDSELTGIAASTTKTAYLKGEELDLNTITVLAAYSDGTEELAKDAYEVTGYDKTKVGDQQITVTFNDKTAVFTVNVADNAVRSFTVEPRTIFVPQGSEVDVTKLTLNVTMDNAESEQRKIQGTPSTVTVTGYDNTQLGTYPVTVTYGGKTASATVRVVSADTIVSIDEVELWWDKDGVEQKYPYKVVSKADTENHNVYFRVMKATTGAGKAIVDRATLDTIRLNTVSMTDVATGQPNTTSAQVNNQNNRLTINGAANLHVALRYTVGGIQIDTPFIYTLNTAVARQITSIERTSGEAIATTASKGISQTARTISFNALDQAGQIYDGATPNALYYTLTKEGATEASVASAVNNYAAGKGKIVTNIAQAGNYTVRIYTTAERKERLGEFTVQAKTIDVPAAADKYDYNVDFATTKHTLDIASFAWNNDYTQLPSTTDSLQVIAQAFVEGVEVDMPKGATVKLKSGAAMTYTNGVVAAKAAVKPATDHVIVTVDNKEVAASPMISLINTLPKYDLLSTSEAVDLFKYFEASDNGLLMKIREQQPLTAIETARLQELVQRALMDTVTTDIHPQAIKEIDVIPTPIESSPDGSRKKVAINVTVRDVFTASGADKVITLHGEYIDVWMNKATAKIGEAVASPATLTVSSADLVREEVQASVVEIVQTTNGTATTLYKGTFDPTVENNTTDPFNATYSGFAGLVEQINRLYGSLFTVTQVGNDIQVVLNNGSSSLNDTTYDFKVNGMSKFQFNPFLAQGKLSIAETMIEYGAPSDMTVGGTKFVFNKNAAAPEFQDKTSKRLEYAKLDDLATLLNIAGGSAPYITARYEGGDIRIETISTGGDGSQTAVTAAGIQVNNLKVAVTTVDTPDTQYRNAWQLGADAVYVGDVTLSFSQAIAIDLGEDGVPTADVTIAYTTADGSDTIRLTPAQFNDHAVINGTTLTIQLAALGDKIADFVAQDAAVKITDVKGLKAVKGFYTDRVEAIYQDVTITKTAE